METMAPASQLFLARSSIDNALSYLNLGTLRNGHHKGEAVLYSVVIFLIPCIVCGKTFPGAMFITSVLI